MEHSHTVAEAQAIARYEFRAADGRVLLTTPGGMFGDWNAALPAGAVAQYAVWPDGTERRELTIWTGR